MLGGDSVPEPVPNTDPGQQIVSPSGSDSPSGGTLIADSDNSVKTSIPESKPDTGTVPDAGSLADGSRGNALEPSGVSGSRDVVPAVDVPPEPEEMTSDPLGKNQVVLLADVSDLSRKTKEALSGAFGAENVSFQEAEGMGSYRQMLKTIIRSNPSVVVICFARQYAEDGISASGYENVISDHVDQFRENGIPCMFVQPSAGDDEDRLQPFLDATRTVCQMRSIPFVNAEDLSGGKFISEVREIKKAE